MWIRNWKESGRASARGFTLMELMVAMAAGVIVSIAAFSFSRQATRAFAQESRIASAQMSVLAGFQRLQSDVSRASYMASSNFNRDASVGKLCGYDLWPPAVRSMSLVGLRVTPEGSKGAFKTTALSDSKFPDSIRIVGNLATTESFTVLSILQGNGAGHDIYIRINDGPASRSGFDGPTGGEFNNVFVPGRLVRVVDMQGRQHYSSITAATWNNGQPFISTAWPLPLKGQITAGAATQAVCGIDGFGTESQVNVVSIVDYGIANLSGATIPQYNNTIYNNEGKPLEYEARGDDLRTELVRRERLLTNDDIAFHLDQTATITTEFAVDLRVALWTTNRTTAGCTLGDTGLAFCDVNTAGIPALMTVGDWGTYAPGMPLTGPDSVRSVRLRLVTRSREIDRKVSIDPPPLATNTGAMFRYPVGNKGYARARTLMADVTLMNQRGDAWY